MPKDLTVKQKMARKLRTKKGRENYSKRKPSVEPVFGQIKRARGFAQFSLRGLEKMRGEWSLVCLTHNLLKLFAARYAVAAYDNMAVPCCLTAIMVADSLKDSQLRRW